MDYTHFIDRYCKIPKDSDRWFRTNGIENSQINTKFKIHEEPFDDDLP